MECKECERLKRCIYSVVAALVNKNSNTALTLARVGMYGGDINNPLDCNDPKRHLNQEIQADNKKLRIPEWANRFTKDTADQNNI